MPKFILIDHSIVDYTGHHFEYAIRVLKAAEEFGYMPVLATNRKFKKLQEISWQVYPVYKYGFWTLKAEIGWYRFFKQISSVLKGWILRQKVRWIFSPLGFFWIVRRQPGEYARRLPLDKRSSPTFLLVLALGYLSNLLRLFVHLVRNAVPARSYVRCLLTSVGSLVRGMCWPILLLVKPKDWMLKWIWEHRRMKQFGKDTLQLFRRVQPEEGDVVFVPTLSAVEMMGLYQYFQKDSRATRASWHLLFHHYLYPRGVNRQQIQEQLTAVRDAFSHFASPLYRQRVFFYTDADELSAQYNSLGVTTCHTLPIPVSEEYGRLGQQSARHNPLRIAYVGDARWQKGYHYLPRIVADLWADYVSTGKVIFVLQSNFNIPEGQPEVWIARRLLEGFPSDQVILLKDALSPEEYRDLIVQSDIILLLYDRDIYYAGSSGILAEALSAGVPVIVPAGTWMARQISDEQYRYYTYLKQTLKVVRVRQVSQLEWSYPNDQLSSPLVQGKLYFGSTSRSAYSELTVPLGADLLLVSFASETRPPDSFVGIYIDQLDSKRNSLHKYEVIVNDSARACPAALVPIQKGVRRIYISFRNVYEDAMRSVSNLEVCFLRQPPSQPCPLGAVGLMYRDPEEVTDLLREMIEHYDHYRQTAQAYAAEWSDIHNPQSLVAELVQRAERTVSALPTQEL